MAVFSLAPRPLARAEERKVLIPFDFISKFDDGRYGQMVGDLIWKKLQREKGFIIPESMADVRDDCQRRKIQPAPDMPLEKMKKIVQEDFGAHIGVWGSVERAPGHEGEVYDLVIKCVDFSAYPDAKVIYECSARTNSVSEIPHLYVKQMLDALYERKPGGPPRADLLAEKNWQENPNLVQGGDFQEGERGVPKGWDAVAGQYAEPLGKLVRWMPEAGSSQNKVVRFTLDRTVAENEGALYYCKLFPIVEGAKYRFQCRWRSNGPTVKVFVKCYDEIGTEYRRQSDKPATAAGAKGRAGKNDYVPEMAQTREVYRSQQGLKGPNNTWNTHTEDFTPKHTEYTPRWCRVMLYAYLTPGVVEFDDVVVKQIVPPSPGAGDKTRRHAQDTKVTVKEMEDNERRSRAAEEREKQGGKKQ